MARNLEDYLNRETLEKHGRTVYETLFLKRPAALPLVLLIVLLLVAWSAWRSPVAGTAMDAPPATGAGEKAGDGNKNTNVSLSRDLWNAPRGVSYKLKSIYTMKGVDYAIINGKDLKVGDRVEQAKVVEIQRDMVKIQEKDKDHPTELRLRSNGLNLEVILPPTPTPEPTPTERPKTKQEPKPEEVEATPTPQPEPETATAEWDWSTWPGRQDFLAEIKDTMLDPVKRKEMKAKWDSEKDSMADSAELTKAMVDWIDRCFEHFEKHG